MFPKSVPLRLKAKDMKLLRIARFLEDRGRCRNCGVRTYLDADEASPVKADLYHIKGRGAGGSDTIQNTENWCHKCHMRFHNGGKPCPKKELIHDAISPRSN